MLSAIKTKVASYCQRVESTLLIRDDRVGAAARKVKAATIMLQNAWQDTSKDALRDNAKDGLIYGIASCAPLAIGNSLLGQAATWSLVFVQGSRFPASVKNLLGERVHRIVLQGFFTSALDGTASALLGNGLGTLVEASGATYFLASSRSEYDSCRKRDKTLYGALLLTAAGNTVVYAATGPIGIVAKTVLLASVEVYSRNDFSYKFAMAENAVYSYVENLKALDQADSFMKAMKTQLPLVNLVRGYLDLPLLDLPSSPNMAQEQQITLNKINALQTALKIKKD